MQRIILKLALSRWFLYSIVVSNFFFPKSINLLLLLLVSVMGAIVCLNNTNIFRLEVLIIIIISLVALHSWLFADIPANMHDYVMELKVICLPLVAALYKKAIGTLDSFRVDSIVKGLVNVFLLCCLISLIIVWLIHGKALRFVDVYVVWILDTGLNSIYVSAGLLLCMAICELIGVRKLALPGFFIFLQGSIAGIAAAIFYVIQLPARKIHFTLRWLVTPGLLLITALLVALYATEIRGRAFSMDLKWIEEFDRYLLAYAAFMYAFQNFDILNWLFGWGVGVQIVGMEAFSLNDQFFFGWILSVRAPDGMTAFILHNEYLRLIYNFGFVGCLLYILYLYKNLDRHLFAAFALLLLFNSHIYANLTIILLGIYMGIYARGVQWQRVASRMARSANIAYRFS
jgi:hypothetical protein